MKTLVLLLTIFVSFVQYSVADEGVGFKFNRNLTLGSTGKDVIKWQEFLIAKGFMILSPGVKLGYFGPITRAATGAFQRASGIVERHGYFGPVTRAFINAQLEPKPKPKPNPKIRVKCGEIRVVTNLRGPQVFCLFIFIFNSIMYIMESGMENNFNFKLLYLQKFLGSNPVDLYSKEYRDSESHVRSLSISEIENLISSSSHDDWSNNPIYYKSLVEAYYNS